MNAYKVYGITKNKNLQNITLGKSRVAAVFPNQAEAAKILVTFDKPELYEITEMEILHVFKS